MKAKFYKNKTKELKSLVRQLSLFSAQKTGSVGVELLIMRIRKLISQISYALSTRQLKRILGPTAVIIGISFAAPIGAQEFADPIRNPFGISGLELEDYIIPSFADLDGDGDLDMIVGAEYGVLKFFENIGNESDPMFASPIDNPFGLSAIDDYIFPTFADLDNDGDIDLLAGGYGEYTANLYYYENIGTAVDPMFSNALTNPFGLKSVYEFAYPDLVDLDDDGDFDLMVGEYGGAKKYFQNVGTEESPTFADALTNPFGLDSTYYLALPTMADLDLDGDQDMLVGGEYGVFHYYENIGSATDPSFGNKQQNPFGLVSVDEIAFPTLVDLDGDGDMDLVAGEEYANLVYFENLDINVATENQSEVHFSIFPNPASTELFIQSEENISIVELVDQNGRVIQTRTGDNSVDISSLENGMYLLRISSEDGRISSRKFIVE